MRCCTVMGGVEADKLTANRLSLGHQDMLDVKRYLAAAHDLRRVQESRGTSEYYDHCEAILVAAVVAYSRPFVRSHSNSAADAKIVPDRLGIFEQRPDLASRHARIIAVRSEAVAHSDWKHRFTEVKDYNYKGGILRRLSTFDVTGVVNIDELQELVEFVASKCLALGSDLDRKVRDELTAKSVRKLS